MKKSKFIQMIALLLVAIMCLSACSHTGTEVATDPQTPASEGTNAAEETIEAGETSASEAKNYWEMFDEVSDTSELPDWPGETLEINIWYAGGTNYTLGTIPEGDVVFKEIERVTGVRINADECFDNGGNSIDAKLPMVIGSGDYPTIIMGHNINNQLEELNDHGYLADLTEYYKDGSLDQITKWLPLEEMDSLVYCRAKDAKGSYYLLPYANNLKQVADLYDATGFDPGEVYDANFFHTHGATPLSAGGCQSDLAIMVRDDILQALYPDINTSEDIKAIRLERDAFTEDEIFDVNLNSTEDFLNFLYDVKELLATGEFTGTDGRPMEVMAGPHTETDNWYWMTYLPALMYGSAADTNYFAVGNYNAQSEDDVLQWAYETDYYKDFMKLLNGLVNDDIISQDSMLDNAATFTEKCMNSHYAVFYGGNFIPYYKEVTGYRPIWVNQPVDADVGGFASLDYKTYFGIFKDTLTDEQMDQLIHFINYLNSIVGINNSYYGPATAGLFTVDADGNRVYNDPDVALAMIKNESNGAGYKYGLTDSYLDEQVLILPGAIMGKCLAPSYLASSAEEKVEDLPWASVYGRFNPGTLAGKSKTENAKFAEIGCNVYGAIGTQVDGCNQFWAARNGFENLVKKIIVSATEDEYNKRYEDLLVYCEENGLTDETLKQFNELFVETNRSYLQAEGIIK